jgi:hypothetical protein
MRGIYNIRFTKLFALILLVILFTGADCSRTDSKETRKPRLSAAASDTLRAYPKGLKIF